MDQIFNLTAGAPLSLSTLAFNLALSLVLAGALAWAYTRYGVSLSNRARFAQIMPLLAMTTVLVISVVKSSVALSLALLSIVRFRTAVKETEELLYLFVSMAVGVGLGADQRAATVLATVVFIAFLVLRSLFRNRPLSSNLYLNVIVPNPTRASPQIREIVLNHAKSADLRRLDRDETSLQATYLIDCTDDEVLYDLMESLQTSFPGCQCSFVEQDNTLGA